MLEFSLKRIFYCAVLLLMKIDDDDDDDDEMPNIQRISNLLFFI
jgi:hypothetical protein